MRVKRILPNGDAVVSSRGFRRLIDQPGNRVGMDFVPVEWADEVAQAFNDCFPDGSQWCEVWTYGQSYRRGVHDC